MNNSYSVPGEKLVGGLISLGIKHEAKEFTTFNKKSQDFFLEDPANKQFTLKDGRLMVAVGGLKPGSIALHIENSGLTVPLPAGIHELMYGTKFLIEPNDKGAGIISKVSRKDEKPAPPKPEPLRFSFQEIAKDRRKQGLFIAANRGSAKLSTGNEIIFDNGFQLGSKAKIKNSITGKYQSMTSGNFTLRSGEKFSLDNEGTIISK